MFCKNDKMHQYCQIDEYAAGSQASPAAPSCCPKVDRPGDIYKTVEPMKDAKREAILKAANEQFKQYGFRKTSMDDIARRMGISRGSLYSYFDNKDEIFRNVSLSVHQLALLEAQDHLSVGSDGSDGSDSATDAVALTMRVEKALLARHSPFQEAVSNSTHGEELFDEYSRLCGDIVQDSHARFQALLATALNEAARRKEIDLKNVGITGKSAAEILNLSAAGLKHGAGDAKTFRSRIKNFTRVFIAGLTG